MAEWIAMAVGKMHIYKITQTELAARLGIRRDYLNKVLAGTFAPKGMEERVLAAIDEIVAERQRTA